MKKIALEEHFLCPGFEDYWRTTVPDIEPEVCRQILGRLYDFGERRLTAMDQAGIEHSVLSIAGPGVQIEPEASIALKFARAANDFLAGEVQKKSDRYSGFAHLAMQDAVAAADELERCVRQLGFCGALINGQTNGQYLDDPAYKPFWERVQALGTVIYLHPADPVAPIPVLAGHRALNRATWEWTFETGSHALRLVFGGVFDRFPGAKLALGHLGETLPFLLWRFDSRAKLYGVKLAKPPSNYIKENIIVTTSGMLSNESLACALSALGQKRVLFSADYPFESSVESGEFIEHAPIDAEARADVCFRNAGRFLKLNIEERSKPPGAGPH